MFFYGKKTTLTWDLERWVWKDATQFLDYTNRIGQNILGPPANIKVTCHKWQRKLPNIVQFKWARIWTKVEAVNG